MVDKNVLKAHAQYINLTVNHYKFKLLSLSNKNIMHQMLKISLVALIVSNYFALKIGSHEFLDASLPRQYN